MTRRIPTIRNGILQEDPEEGASSEALAIESTAWYSWVEQHRSFRFEDSTLTFTARKEPRAGSWYWYAYRRLAGRLHTAYLGRSAELSSERLNTVATVLERAEDTSEETGHHSQQRSSDALLQTPHTTSIPSPIVVSVAGSLTEAKLVPKHNLPIQMTSLVGRESATTTATALLRRPEVRLLSMIGTGGIGKTRLAIAVATELLEDFTDGIFFVALAPLRDPDMVLPTIAHTLNLEDSGSEPITDRLHMYLRDKQLLLVLDNFEHLMPAAPFVGKLLTICPNLKLLITSREVLHLRAEQQFSVPPLAVPIRKHAAKVESLTEYPALDLFLQRARAAKHEFQLHESNAQSLAEICSRLDGLPLAIELAAARIGMLSPQALLARLDHRLQVLTHGPTDLPERQQTLRRTIQWSYELLKPEEQRLFQRLSVFAGGATLEAVEAICGTLGDETGKVFDGVASLLDKSLIQQQAHEDGQPRLMMLETIREYGLEALETSGKMEATRWAHATYYLRLVERAEQHLNGQEQIRWFERLERENDNLRAALSWFLEQGSDVQGSELALRMGGVLALFWEIRGYVSEGQHWLERALDESRGVRSAVRAKVLIGAGWIASFKDDFAQAEVLCGEGLALYRELGDRRGSASALSSLGYAAMMRSNYAEACEFLEEALALFREVGDTGGCASALSLLASVLFYRGEYARAQVLFEESRVLSWAVGDFWSHARSLAFLSLVLLFQVDLARAHSCLEESLAVSKEVGYKRNIGLSIFFLGMVTYLQGDLARARSLLVESLVLLKEVGERGRIAEVFLGMGFISFSQGDYAAARPLMEESLNISLELDIKWDIAVCLEGLAAVAAAQGEPIRAVWFMSAAQALREAIEIPLPSLYQVVHEYAITSVRKQLGEQAFATAWAEGCTMTPEQALAAHEPVAIPMAASAEPSMVPPVSKAPTYPEGLTAREMEVLRLLAQGLTSAQIAEQLTIGLVTVNSHVRSIYSKLGVTSRAAATRYALEHHLL